MIAALPQPIEIAGFEQVVRRENYRVDRTHQIGGIIRPAQGDPVFPPLRRGRVECAEPRLVKTREILAER
jgi:hypothetical protein